MTTLDAPSMSFDADVLAEIELAAWPHWLCWRYENDAKVPKGARTGRNASSTAPADWAPLDVAVGRALREGWGVGFVFHGELNPFAGVDLDHCRDLETGTLAPWALSIVRAFDSYCEVSPSGTGVKIVVRGKPPHNGRKTGTDGSAVELYGHARYFTMTGCAPMSRPIRDGQAMLDALCARLWPPASPAPQRHASRVMERDDHALIERASTARNGALFRDLWAGNWRGRYGSQSEADLALVGLLSFWCDGDQGRVDRLFRQSGLYRPKWDRVDYRVRTLERGSGGRA